MKNYRNILFAACLPALGCQGRYEIRAYGEAFVEAGIPAEEVKDGWGIVFSEFVVSIGDVSVEGEERHELPGWYVFDLTRPSQGQGHLLGAVEAPYGDYTTLRYRIASPGELAGGNATAAQVAHLEENKAALHVVGAATKGDVTLALDWTFPISFGHKCKIAARVDGNDQGGTQMTIHADHLLLNDLGPNGDIAFDLMATADANSDGLVVAQELAHVNILTEERFHSFQQHGEH